MATDPKLIAESLQDAEIAVLNGFAKEKKDKLTELSKLKQIEFLRAGMWLENKGLVKSDKKEENFIILDTLGRKYLKLGLPERRLLLGKPVDKEELKFCIGHCFRRGWMEKGSPVAPGKFKPKITELGKKYLKEGSFEEKLLQKLSSRPVKIDSLEPQEKFAFENLNRRKSIIRVVKKKSINLHITDLGKKIAQELSQLDKDRIGLITPKVIQNQEWKTKKFRRFDVSANVPDLYPNKRHFVNQAREYAKKIWLEMGFKEMTGDMIQTSFWNFDALFTAQDHPVREMQDTFFISKPAHGKLPEKKIVDEVKKAHEVGVAGSKGWQYNWDINEAKRNVLRTHTTCLSARTLANLKKDDLPAKFFSIGKVFRNEALDWAHLFEFYHVEGIVVGKDLNFRQLLGYLKRFFKKMGYPDARFRPAHFPYTEPSVEIEILHPVHKKWIELGGAGMFRPEVLEPLFKHLGKDAKDLQVLAWGPGFDRSLMEYYNITDLRQLYKNDLKTLKEMRYWVKCQQ